MFASFLCLILFIWILTLQNRISILEEKHKESKPIQTLNATSKVTANPAITEEEHHPTMATPVPPADPPQSTPTAQPAPVSFAPMQSQAPQEPSPVVVWLQENTLIKIGAFIFFLGAVWFVSYAIAQGWISPPMRIFLGILTGIVAYGVGHWRNKTNETQYLVLTTLGTGIIIASIYAGQFMFEIFVPPFALLLLTIAIAYTVYVSVITRAEWLAVTSVIAGLISPLLVNSPDPNATAFFSYLLILAIAFLGVVLLTHWRTVTLTLALGVVCYEYIFYFADAIEDAVLWLFVLIFAALFYCATTTSLLKHKNPLSVDVFTLGFTSVTLLLWTHSLASNDALMTTLYALVTGVTAYVIYQKGYREHLITLYVALTALFVLTATGFAFSGFTLTFAYALEVTFAIAVAMRLQLPDRAVTASSLAYALPIIASLPAFSSQEWKDSILQPSAYALYTIVVSALFIVVWALWHHRKYGKGLYESIGGIFLIIFWIFTTYVITLVWGTLIADEAMTHVYRYISWAFLSFAVTYGILKLQLDITWLPISAGTFLLPLFASISSFTSEAWEDSISHPDAIGLYVIALLFLALGMVFSHTQSTDRHRGEMLNGLTTVALVVAGSYIVALVWLITHALFGSEDTAVSVALFTYTVAGLIFYTAGKTEHSKQLTYTGIVLLGLVVLRLVLIEVWNMEMLGRIVTFLGIGLLFILTALFEKPFQKNEVAEHSESDVDL